MKIKSWIRIKLWTLVRPHIRFEWGQRPLSRAPYCEVYLFGHLMSVVEGYGYHEGRHGLKIMDLSGGLKDKK